MSRITGTNADDAFAGLWQNDQLYGRGGNDYLDGGAGNDRVYGQDGDDVLIGGTGSDQLYGGHGNDVLDDGTFGADNAILHGGAGNDQLYGIVGQLSGDAGDDGLNAWGKQEVVLWGGPGADTFNLQLDGGDAFLGGHHTFEVKDFDPAHGDRLNLTAIDGYGNTFDDAAIRGAFDDNHDGKLTAAGDTYVVPDAQGDGIVLQWWGMDLHLDHVQELAATTAATEFLM
jgi:Ca2+-binding RTX toxin-like protein